MIEQLHGGPKDGEQIDNAGGKDVVVRVIKSTMQGHVYQRDADGVLRYVGSRPITEDMIT